MANVPRETPLPESTMVPKIIVALDLSPLVVVLLPVSAGPLATSGVPLSLC